MDDMNITTKAPVGARWMLRARASRTDVMGWNEMQAKKVKKPIDKERDGRQQLLLDSKYKGKQSPQYPNNQSSTWGSGLSTLERIQKQVQEQRNRQKSG